jgi:UDP-N-acetylmuramate-alanine ligase
MPDFDDIVKFLKKIVQVNDIIVIQGAGNINQFAKRLIEEFK